MKKLILLLSLLPFLAKAQTYNNTTWANQIAISGSDTLARQNLGTGNGYNYGPFLGNTFTHPTTLFGNFNVASPTNVLTFAPTITATADVGATVLYINPTVIPNGHQLTVTGINNAYNLVQKGNSFFTGVVKLNTIAPNFFTTNPANYNITGTDSLGVNHWTFVSARNGLPESFYFGTNVPTKYNGYGFEVNASFKTDSAVYFVGIPSSGTSVGVLNIASDGHIFKGSGGSSGTVTSVGATGSNGVIVSGTSPITTSGTFGFQVDSTAYTTRARLSTYLTKAQILALGYGQGTVTSFGKVDGYGITSSVANSTTTPVHTVAVDSTSSGGVVSKTRLATNLGGYQKTLTAGTNITITGTTISASGGGGSTTNALTVTNTNTGASPGTTFNGSAAVTVDLKTLGAQSSLTWINVMDPQWGVVADGTTDNTTALRAIAAATPSTGCVIYTPPTSGKIAFSDSVVFSQPNTYFYGAGGIGPQVGSVSGNKLTSVDYPASTYLFTVGNKNGFIFSGQNSGWDGVCVVSTSSSTPTSSHLLLVKNYIGWNQRNCSFYYGYENEHLISGYNSYFSNVFWNGAVKYNLVKDNQLTAPLNDAGDDSFVNCNSYQGTYSGSSHILLLNGGGPKFVNLKLNQQGANIPVDGIDIFTKTSPTILFEISNSSIENYTGTGINAQPTNTTFGFITVNGVEFNPNASGGTTSTGNDCIIFGNGSGTQYITGGNISGCTFITSGLGVTTGGTTYTGYNIVANAPNLTIGDNTYLNHTNTTVPNMNIVYNFAAANSLRFTNYQNTITDASSVTYDFMNGVNQKLTLSQNTAMSILNYNIGYGKLAVFQNGTGGYTLTSAGAAHIVGSVGQVNPAPNSVTLLDVTPAYDGTGYVFQINDWRSTDYGNLSAQTSVGTIKSITSSAANATYNISGYVNVTAIATDVVQYQITYTDENNTAQTISGPNISATGNNTIPLTQIRVKASTTITVKTNLTTGLGTITFDAGATIAQVN